MENYPLLNNFGYHCPVPIVGDVSISRMWGDKLEVPADTIVDEGRFDKWLKKNVQI